MPRGLGIEEIPVIIEQYVDAAQMAKRAGFDGAEIHGAIEYLIEQFLKDGTNRRTDAYGGKIANRICFALDVVQATVAVWGPEQVGFRIYPRGVFNDMRDSDPLALYRQLVKASNDVPLAYLHLIEPLPGHPSFKSQEDVPAVATELRKIFRGT